MVQCVVFFKEVAVMIGILDLSMLGVGMVLWCKCRVVAVHGLCSIWGGWGGLQDGCMCLLVAYCMLWSGRRIVGVFAIFLWCV